jgi:hypothetical protein
MVRSERLRGDIKPGLFAGVRSCFPYAWQASFLFILCYEFRDGIVLTALEQALVDHPVSPAF